MGSGHLDQQCSNVTHTWTTNGTKLLIDLYKKYKKDVGKLKMKNFKTMWAQIAVEISALLGINVTPKNCENRWKVLDRNYKRWVDNQKSTGRGRKVFEFADEMNDVYGKKKNINPTLLLESETINIPSEKQMERENEELCNMNDASLGTPLGSSTLKIKESKKEDEVIRRRNLRQRKNVLEQMREERLKYQKEKLQLIHDSQEKILKLLQERNDLKRERNEILRNNRLDH